MRSGERSDFSTRSSFAQARRNLHALCAQLCARLPPVLPEWRGELRLPHGHAVLLPDVPVARRLVPGGMAPELLLDAAALAAPEPRLRAAMQAWAGARPPLPRRTPPRKSSAITD